MSKIYVIYKTKGTGMTGKFGYIPDPPEIDCDGYDLDKFDMDDCRLCSNYDDCLKEYRAYMESEDKDER